MVLGFCWPIQWTQWTPWARRPRSRPGLLEKEPPRDLAVRQGQVFGLGCVAWTRNRTRDTGILRPRDELAKAAGIGEESGSAGSD